MTYKYQSYKKGNKVYQIDSCGEQGDFLGTVSRQTKYSFFYIDERGRERMKYRNIIK
jgi:diphthamide synthase (EF-2-diphthine--ammonia ligase)